MSNSNLLSELVKTRMELNSYKERVLAMQSKIDESEQELELISLSIATLRQHT